MIKFWNGHELTFACGSGALAFDGRGWWFEQPFRWLGLLDPKAFTVVAKTVTVEPVVGNLSMWHPWTCIRVVRRRGRRGMVNAVGLTNPGLRHWATVHYPVARRMGYAVAASVRPNTVAEARLMADVLGGLTLAYVEVNGSCPNVGHLPPDLPDMLWALRGSGHPLVVKLSREQVRPAFVRAVDDLVDAYHAINTVPWDVIFTEPSPIEKYAHRQKGGVSGDFINLQALVAVQSLKEMTGKPVIGGGGIMHVTDVFNFESSGAAAFSIGTLFPLRPWEPNRIVRQYHHIKRCQPSTTPR